VVAVATETAAGLAVVAVEQAGIWLQPGLLSLLQQQLP
jgi:hypothetical protein